MSANAFVKEEAGGDAKMPECNGWYHVVDPCDQCTQQKRNNRGHFHTAALACMAKPRPHPFPKTRRVHISKASKKVAMSLIVRLFWPWSHIVNQIAFLDSACWVLCTTLQVVYNTGI